jgi:hypothetical protein
VVPAVLALWASQTVSKAIRFPEVHNAAISCN